jgi:hypothetical protein
MSVLKVPRTTGKARMLYGATSFARIFVRPVNESESGLKHK